MLRTVTNYQNSDLNFLPGAQMDVAGSTTEGQQLQSEFPSGAFGNAPLANIDIFLRVKPVPRPTNRIVIDPLDGNVEFNIPKDTAAG